MADEQDLERNYPATPRRLEQARERGQVARSRELSTAAIAFAAAITLSHSEIPEARSIRVRATVGGKR
jgi:flagellar biosynthesis protein FlhB